MIPTVDKGLIAFISKNKNTFYTFLILALISANVYQYLENRREERALNQRLDQLSQETIKYERQRSERFEFLLNALTTKKQ